MLIVQEKIKTNLPPAIKKFSDQTIIVSCLKANDKAAFEYLYDHYSAALFSIVFKILKDEHTAADVVQDSFLKIWKSIQAYDPAKGSLFTWMLNITRNCAIDCYRVQARTGFYVDLEKVDQSATLYAYSTLPMLELVDLWQLMQELQPDKRQLIDLVYVQGFTHEEVAQMLTIPLGTVKSRIKKSLAQLRSYFQDPALSLLPA